MMRIIVSNSRNATENLALEQQLLLEPESVVLLYVNDKSVIVGRNQTIEAEVDCAYCKSHGIDIVRRESGGGTVYHDCGNVNYAFIVNADKNPLDRDYTEPIVWALREMGVDAITGSRGEILVGGAKVSGSASMVKRSRVLFHGTLLFDSDLQMLSKALSGDESLRGKGVKSVRSSVCNLKPLLPNVPDISHFISELCSLLKRYYDMK